MEQVIFCVEYLSFHFTASQMWSAALTLAVRLRNTNPCNSRKLPAKCTMQWALKYPTNPLPRCFPVLGKHKPVSKGKGPNNPPWHCLLNKNCQVWMPVGVMPLAQRKSSVPWSLADMEEHVPQIVSLEPPFPASSSQDAQLQWK